MACKMCNERGKTWEGSDPSCAFENCSEFSDNWNCATLNKLRRIAESHNFINYCEQSSIASIPFDSDEHFGWVVISWYKSRGRTGVGLYVTDESYYPLTEKIAVDCIEYWKGR